MVSIGDIKIGKNQPLVLIAGPCIIESEDMANTLAIELKSIAQELTLPFIFKASFDKANRSSINSFRGPGLKEGLRILAAIKKQVGVPILTDVHCVSQVDAVAAVADIIQIPAFLCRQTDLIIATAKTGKVVNVKKGQFLSPWDMKNVVQKIESTGNKQILLTERGTSFGYNNLVVDMRSLPIMRSFGYPVIFDGTHSVQQPGSAGDKTGGDREMVPYLCRAAVAAGCDGIFLEVHEQPDKAKSDAANALALHSLKPLLQQLIQIHNLISEFGIRNSELKTKSKIPQSEISNPKSAIIYTDGASRGNPGEAGVGVLITDTQGKELDRIAKYIGITTNNVAEYTALIEGLNAALARGITEVQVISDSELLVRQVSGKYKVKQPHLQKLYQQVKSLTAQFKNTIIEHVPREKNREADSLANEAIDEKTDF